jgi:hypothetical protein
MGANRRTLEMGVFPGSIRESDVTRRSVNSCIPYALRRISNRRSGLSKEHPCLGKVGLDCIVETKTGYRLAARVV